MDMNVLWIAIAVQGALVGGLTYTEKSRKCWNEVGYCITLFVNDVGIPWAQAKHHCEENGGILLEIKSPSVQQHAASLTVQLVGSKTAWIGGSRLRDNRLRNMDAHLHLDNFASAIDNLNDTKLNCVYAVMVNNDIQYELDNCDEKHGHHSVLCKRHSVSAPGTVCLGEVTENGACYVVMYTGNSASDQGQPGPDWFSAQNLCRWESSGFDLFGETDVDLITFALNHVGANIWTGFFRNPWVWSNEEIISYFNWGSAYNDSSNRECMTIDEDGKWRHTVCQELRTHHMCLKNIPSNGTSTTVGSTTSRTDESPSQTRVTEALATNRSPDATQGPIITESSVITSMYTTTVDTTESSSTSVHIPTESSLDGLPEGLPIYAGAAAGGVLLLVVIVIVVVCVVRKRNTGDTKSHDYANQLESTLRQEQPTNNQQYEMVPDNFLSSPTSGDLELVAPYAEFGGVAHPGTETAAGATDPNYDIAAAVSGDYSEQTAVGDTSHVAGDMEDVVVDNALYGAL